jgi:hypothetical protein
MEQLTSLEWFSIFPWVGVLSNTIKIAIAKAIILPE